MKKNIILTGFSLLMLSGTYAHAVLTPDDQAKVEENLKHIKNEEEKYRQELIATPDEKLTKSQIEWKDRLIEESILEKFKKENYVTLGAEETKYVNKLLRKNVKLTETQDLIIKEMSKFDKL